MGIGQRKQVRLEQVLITIDAEGRNIESAGESFSMWAEVLNPSGSREYANGQTQMSQNKKFIIRFRFDRFLDCEWKIGYAGRTWTVSEIQNVDEKKFYWSLTAQSKSHV